MNKEKNLNSLALAYLGDAIYEICIRKYLLEQNITKVKALQSHAIQFVSANNQAKFMKQLMEEDQLNEEEKNVVLRARNHKVNHKPKNTDIITYKNATALEALIGWLYLKKDYGRIKEIIEYIKEKGK